MPKPELVEGADPSMKLSIVVPCYNEEDGLRELRSRVERAAEEAVGQSYEIIFVDDGSVDGTWGLIEEFVRTDEHIVGVRLSRNHGHQLALTAGLSSVSGEMVLVLDADLQDPPELLSAMLVLMQDRSADVVYGQRRTRAGETHLKRGTASLFYRLFAWATEIGIPVDTGDFRLMTRRVADLLVSMPERDRFVRGMVAWLGFTQVPILYDRDARHVGRTKYPFSRMVGFALDAFLGYSRILLRIAAFLAAVFLVVLIGLSFFILYAWLYLNTVPGWTSLALLIAAVSACQLLVLSILGEYIGRIYLEGKRRPLFVVQTIIRGRHNQSGQRPLRSIG